MSSEGITVHHGEEINNSTGVSNKKLLMDVDHEFHPSYKLQTVIFRTVLYLKN